MSYTDANGIVRVETGDNISPLHPVLNMIAKSVSDKFDDSIGINRVNDKASRNELVSSPLPSRSNPLFVWRNNAPAGQQLEYTVDGTNWYNYESTEYTDDTGWVEITQYASGFSGDLKVRRRQDHVVVTGEVLGSIPQGNTTLCPPGTLAENFWPEFTQFGSAFFSGGHSGVSFVRSDGSIAVAQRSGGTRTHPQTTISFLLG